MNRGRRRKQLHYYVQTYILLLRRESDVANAARALTPYSERGVMNVPNYILKAVLH